MTVIPANVVGSGTTLALTGCDERTVFNPVTNNVVIWPGATLMIEGSVYPVPDSVIPCPKIGARFMANSQIEMRSIWRIVGRLILKSRLDGKGSAFCGAFEHRLFQRPLWTRFQLQAGPLFRNRRFTAVIGHSYHFVVSEDSVAVARSLRTTYNFR